MAPYSNATWRTPIRFKGFTLIEVMIVVVILGILIAVAWPAYQDHLRKGRRAGAQSFMIEVANRENQFLLDARNYAVNIANLNAANALNITTPADITQYYTVSVGPAAVTTPPSFTITATPTGAQANDAYGVMTLTHEGAKRRKVGTGQEASGW